MKANQILVCVSLAAVAVVGCGGQVNGGDNSPSPESRGITVSVAPTSASVAVGGTYAFKSVVTGTKIADVTWRASGGTIVSTGTSTALYTAPSTPGTYTVTVASDASGSVKAVATVTVTSAGSSGGVEITLTPASTQIVAGSTSPFAATVTGSTDTAVTWTATGGTVASTGTCDANYTAPASAGSYTLTATSVADTTKSASATVTVTSAPAGGSGSSIQSCASEPMRTTGTVYYFCDCESGAASGCVAGNDSNAGTSPSAPKQHFSTAAALFNTMAAGDTIALCQGGAFTGSYTGSSTNSAHNANCQSSTVPAYGSTTSCDIRNYAAPWNAGGEGYPIISGSSYGLDFDDPNNTTTYSGYRAFNLALTGSTSFEIVVGHRTSNVDLCNLTVHDNTGGGGVIGQPAMVSGVTIRESRFYNLGGQGWLEACSNMTVTDNYWANIGGSKAGSNPQQHILYLGGDSTGVPTGVTISNNEMHAIVGAGGPVTIVAHTRVDNLSFVNNVIYGAGDGYGIQLDQGGEGQAEGFNHAVIRGNQLLDVTGIGVQVDQCPNCIVEDNVITVGGSGYSYGIASGQTSDCSESGCLGNTNLVFRNNSIYFLSGSNGAAISLGGDGTNHLIVNNAIAGTGSFECIATPLSAGSYQMVANNACTGDSSFGTSYGTGNITASFSFTNPTATPPDFSFASGSPLAGAGTSAATCTVGGVANQDCYSPYGISQFPWSATAALGTRTSRPDVGAYIYP